jgi:hypothetical protein
MAHKISCFPNNSTTNSPTARIPLELDNNTNHLINVLLVNSDTWNTWINTYFAPLIPPIAPDGTLQPFFTLRSGIKSPYVHYNCPSTSTQPAINPLFIDGSFNVEGDVFLFNKLDKLPPLDVHITPFQQNNDVTTGEVVNNTPSDTHPTPHSATPASVVCDFMSHHGIIPPRAVDILYPLIHHILQPTVLDNIQDGSVSITNAIYMLSRQDVSNPAFSPHIPTSSASPALQPRSKKRRRLNMEGYSSTTNHSGASTPQKEVRKLIISLMKPAQTHPCPCATG